MVKGKENEKFCFSDFEEMREAILRKLTYYFHTGQLPRRLSSICWKHIRFIRHGV